MDVSRYSVLTAIVGFVYLLGLFFIALICINKYDLGFLGKASSYTPYIILVIIPLSYIIGSAANIILNYIIVPCIIRIFKKKESLFGCIRKIFKKAESFKEDNDDDFYLYQYGSKEILYDAQANSGILYASRLLICGFIFLGFFLYCWFQDRTWYGIKNWHIIILFGFLIIISSVIYLHSRKAEKRLKDIVKFLKKENNKESELN